jgi:PilZ domain
MKRFFAKPPFSRPVRSRPETTAFIADIDPLNRRRSERVLLQVPVNLEIPQSDGRFLRGDAYTLSVNAHGGLLEMGTRVDRGQKLILANPGTGVREPGRVVHCDKSQNGYFAVAFEFDTPAPNFWPLVFPPTDWKLIER